MPSLFLLGCESAAANGRTQAQVLGQEGPWTGEPLTLHVWSANGTLEGLWGSRVLVVNESGPVEASTVQAARGQDSRGH